VKRESTKGIHLKRNFQVMSAAEWLALLCKHIPDRYEHLVHYIVGEFKLM